MTNGYNFTERVRRVLAMSREEAQRLHHAYVGTEHILLGLIRDGEGVGAAVLQSLDVNLEEVRKDVERHVESGKPGNLTGPDLPYTSRAKKILELSMAEARDLSHSYVGTEHLLLGILREEKGIAAQMLTNHNVTLGRAHTEVLRLLGSLDGSVPAPVRDRLRQQSPTPVRPSASNITAVFVDFQYEDGSTLRKEFANIAWAIKYLENTW